VRDDNLEFMKSTEHITDVLQSFSFSQDEADVYIAALSLGRASISQISRKLNKSRTATHFHIQKLLERKVLQHIKKGGRHVIRAIPPKELINDIHAQTSYLERLLPQLESLARIDTESPRFDMSESREGYWKVYEEISYLPKGSSIRMLEGKKAVENELSLLLPYQWETFWSRIIERNIQTDGLFTEELISSSHRMINDSQRAFLGKRVWNIRTLPHSFLPIDQLMILYKDKAAFLFPESALVLLMQHRGVTSILAGMFDSLYAFAKPLRNPWQKSV